MKIALVALQFEVTTTGGGGVHVEKVTESISGSARQRRLLAETHGVARLSVRFFSAFPRLQPNTL